jgi:hypothetical protein
VTEQILTGWLRDVAEQMMIGYRASGRVEHRGSKGTVREQDAVSTWLVPYMPQHLRIIPGGEIRDVDGQVSSQQDIMIADPTTPALFTRPSYQVVPVECVYAAAEVKSNLTPDEMERSWVQSARL